MLKYILHQLAALSSCPVKSVSAFLQWGTCGHVMGLDVSAGAKNNKCNIEDKVPDQSLKKKKNWSNENKEFCCLAFRDTQGLKNIIC